MICRAIVFAALLSLMLQAHSKNGDAQKEPGYPKAAFGFVALNVADLEKAAAFYQKVIGLTVQKRLDEGSSKYIFLDVPGNTSFPRLALTANAIRKEPYVKGDAYSRCAFFVSNIDAVLERAKNAGAAVALSTDDKAHRIKVAMLTDPDGYSVELLESY